MLQGGRDPGVRENQGKHHQVIDGQRFLEEVRGDVQQAGLGTQPNGDPGSECKCDTDPQRAPHPGRTGGAPFPGAVRVDEIDDEQARHQRDEDRPFEEARFRHGDGSVAVRESWILRPERTRGSSSATSREATTRTHDADGARRAVDQLTGAASRAEATLEPALFKGFRG